MPGGCQARAAAEEKTFCRAAKVPRQASSSAEGGRLLLLLLLLALALNAQCKPLLCAVEREEGDSERLPRPGERATVRVSTGVGRPCAASG